MKRLASVCTLTLLASLLAAPVHAQKRLSGPRPRGDDPSSESHRRLDNGVDDLLRPEEALQQRLTRSRHLRELNPADPNLNSDLVKLAQKLMKDREFVRSLQGLSRNDLNGIKERLRQEGFSTNDPQLRNLLEQGRKALGKLDEGDRELLQRWKQKASVQPDGPANGPMMDNGGNRPGEGEPWRPPVPPAMNPTPPSTPPSWQQAPSRSGDWFKRGLDRFLENMDSWVSSPSGKSWADTLKNLARRAEARRVSPSHLGERVGKLSRWMAQVTGADQARLPRLGSPRLPNLPRFGSVPGVSLSRPRSLAGPVKLAVALTGVALVALLLLRGRDWFASLHARRAGWRPGPWPVQPGDVSTRGELVRAFEHLALVCLGPSARTCHHLELAERIGAQPALDAERRRESAGDLAQLYEQARYAPDATPLPAEDLRRARRELAYLAGTAVA